MTADEIVRRAPLTWGQEVLWFQHEMLPDNARQTLNVCLEMDLSENASVEGVAAAIDVLVKRHEALRTVLAQSAEEGVFQQVHDDSSVSISIEHVDASSPGTDLHALRLRLMDAPFDLYADFPMRAGLATGLGDRSTLIIVLHHIVVDEWSLEMLKEELLAELHHCGSA